MRSALVMEGGSMKGLFTCGIMDVLMENGITFDGAIGVSAGAAFGCNLKSRQIGRGIRYNKRFAGDKRYASFRSFLTTGDLFNVDFAYRRIPFELDPWDAKTFAENPMEFISVSTCVDDGQADYHVYTTGIGEDLQFLRASASVPVVSRTVEINGKGYLDGGVADPIPIRYMQQRGYDRIIVIPTKPYGYRREDESLLVRMAMNIRYHRNKGFLEAFRNMKDVYNDTNDYIQMIEDAKEILVLRPTETLTLPGIPKDPEDLERVYQMGRKVATERLEEVRRYLSV